MKKLITDFTKMSDATFLLFAREVVASFSNNSYFPVAPPLLPQVVDGINTFGAALSVSGRYFPRVNSVIKNQDRKALNTLLVQLAVYVMDEAEGDLVTLSSTRFQLYKKRLKLGVLPQPTNLQLVAGPLMGAIEVSIDRVRGAGFICSSSHSWALAVALPGTLQAAPKKSF